MSGPRPKDPVEGIIYDALTKARIPFVMDGHGDTMGLDFFLPGRGVFIECKQFHTPRVSEQMRRVSNIICIQGVMAAETFAAMVRGEV